jgi:hypothetical protein
MVRRTPGSDDQTDTHPENLYPEWSWDNVRTYVAVRRGDEYSDEQIEILAKQDIVMLEKMNGHETHGSVEKGTLEAAKRIKAINPKVKILFYLNTMLHYGAYDANNSFKEEWALKHAESNEAYKWRNVVVSYDHTNVEFRTWWVQRALDMLVHDEIDGIFIDAICKTHHNVLRRLKGATFVEEHANAYLETAKELREKLPAGKILIGNVLRAGNRDDGNYGNLQHLDGSYLENWSDPNQLTTTIQLMSKALKENKIIMLNADMSHADLNHIDSLDERYNHLNQPEFIDFPLGIFLLVVEKHAYFSYHVGVDLKPNRRSGLMLTVFDNTRFDAITRKLGKPLGDYVDDGEGGFSREFEFLTVTVNVTSRQGTLTVKGDKMSGDEL